MKQLFIFSAEEWCSACKQLKQVLHDTPVPVDQLRVFDVDASPDLAREYQVRGVPTSIILEDGKEVRRKTGTMLRSELIAFCEGS